MAVVTTEGNGHGREITIAPDLNGRNDPMSTTTLTMLLAAAMPAWIPSRLYRMTLEQYEAMAASGAIPTSHRVHLINGYLVEKVTPQSPARGRGRTVRQGARSRRPAGLARARR